MQRPTLPKQPNQANQPYDPGNDRRTPQEEDLFRAEMVQSEREWLHEEVRSLQQAPHQRRQDLQKIERELELMNQEIMDILKVMPPSLHKVKAFANLLLLEGDSTTEAFAKLLSFIYGETVVPQELEQINGSDQFTRSATFSLGGLKHLLNVLALEYCGTGLENSEQQLSLS